MLQVVCIKQVPDTETRVRVATDGRTLDPAGVTWIVNPYDEFAIEAALQLKEKTGAGEVVVISLGGPGVATAIRSALAMGADRAIHLKSDAPAPDSLGVARALAGAIRDLGAEIVWFGKQAVDDDAAQVGPMVAELLALPCATLVSKFELDGRTARIEREIEGGLEIVELPLPAVLTTDKGLNQPRFASLKGIMAAKKKPIEERAADLGGANLEVLALELPPARAAGRIVGEGVAAVPELVRVLREEAKVL
ncbi:MAG: electron transfer flavoprotein subunit beta/FixA family protein [Candidatus Eisenbacteria bacterium]|nr:electron transfer flavoprotein subunit beta/FixA family protein [Candidatus Eisenbacteria bacterium]